MYDESGSNGEVRFRRLKHSTGILLLYVTFFLVGCTTLSPVSDDAQTLQEKIRTGKALKQGDRVRVVTSDGVLHRIEIISVEDDVVKGHPATDYSTPIETNEVYEQEGVQKKAPSVDIPIADIILVEKEKISAVKTAGAIGGGTLVFIGVLFLIAVASM